MWAKHAAATVCCLLCSSKVVRKPRERQRDARKSPRVRSSQYSISIGVSKVHKYPSHLSLSSGGQPTSPPSVVIFSPQTADGSCPVHRDSAPFPLIPASMPGTVFAMGDYYSWRTWKQGRASEMMQ